MSPDPTMVTLMTDTAQSSARSATRSDVIRNRAKILAAAEAVFSEHGAAAPLDLVVRRAGVGRGTLYRHFADRESLVAALYAVRVDVLESHAMTHQGPRLLESLLRRMWALHQQSPGLFGVLASSERSRSVLDELSARVHLMIDRAVEIDSRAGMLHPEVTPQVARDLLALLPAHVVLGEDGARDSAVLEVVIRGLRPAC